MGGARRGTIGGRRKGDNDVHYYSAPFRADGLFLGPGGRLGGLTARRRGDGVGPPARSALRWLLRHPTRSGGGRGDIVLVGDQKIQSGKAGRVVVGYFPGAGRARHAGRGWGGVGALADAAGVVQERLGRARRQPVGRVPRGGLTARVLPPASAPARSETTGPRLPRAHEIFAGEGPGLNFGSKPPRPSPWDRRVFRVVCSSPKPRARFGCSRPEKPGVEPPRT